MEASLRAVMVMDVRHYHFIHLFYDATMTAVIMQVRLRHETKCFKYEGRLGDTALIYCKLLAYILQEEIPELTQQVCSWNTKPRTSRVQELRDNVLLTLSEIVSINSVTC